MQAQLKNVQHVQASMRAVAAILDDGSVVTWGDPNNGGDSSSVQDQLRDVQQIKSHATAFAAVVGNGSVVTWGDPQEGGDRSFVHDRLNICTHDQSLCGSSRPAANNTGECGSKSWRM